MGTLEQIKVRIEQSIPGARLEIIPNGSAANQPSLLVSNAHAVAVAKFLRDDPQLQFDYASNVTGIDWLDQVAKEKVKVKKVVDGAEREVEETIETKAPGYLEAVYHLYSMALKHGPLILRQQVSVLVHLPTCFSNRSQLTRLAFGSCCCNAKLLVCVAPLLASGRNAYYFRPGSRAN